jgi:hypothetical protein
VADPAAEIAKAYPKAGVALARKIVEIAGKIGAHPYDLANVMAWESAFTFDPRQQYDRKLGEPFSSHWTNARGQRVGRATGMIQFMPSTAKKLGTTTRALYAMSAPQQMEYVQRYFDMVRSGKPLDTYHKVAMAVFYVPAIQWAPNRPFGRDVTNSNPATLTPRHYTDKARRHFKLPTGAEAGPVETEPGMFEWMAEQASSAWEQAATGLEGLFGPTEEEPATLQRPSAPATHWRIDGDFGARLVSQRTGQGFSPGSIPPGMYALETRDAQGWQQQGAIPYPLRSGVKYHVYQKGGRMAFAPI